MFALVLVLAAAPGADSKIAAARAALDQFQFDRALTALADAQKERGLSRAQLITIFELEGIARATRNDANGAKEAFARLLTLDPTRPVPPELPPKVRTLFFGARTIAQRTPLELVAEDASRVDALVTLVSVRVKTSPLLSARAVRFSVSTDGQPPTELEVPLTGEDTVSAPVAQGRSVTWTATLLGANDAELAEVSREEKAIVAEPPPVTAAVQPAAPPADWGRPLGVVLAVGGVVAAGIGVGFGVQSADARRQLANAQVDGNGVVTGLTEVQAQRLDALAVTDAAAGNTLMIGGAALAAVGAVVFFVGPRGTSVAVTPSPGGLVAVGSF